MPKEMYVPLVCLLAICAASAMKLDFVSQNIDSKNLNPIKAESSYHKTSSVRRHLPWGHDRQLESRLNQLEEKFKGLDSRTRLLEATLNSEPHGKTLTDTRYISMEKRLQSIQTQITTLRLQKIRTPDDSHDDLVEMIIAEMEHL